MAFKNARTTSFENRAGWATFFGRVHKSYMELPKRVAGRGSRAPALILSWDPSLKSSLGVLLMPGQVEVLKFSVLIRMKVDKNNWCMQLLYSTLVMGSLHLGGCALLPSLREGLMIFLSTVTQT